MITIEDYVRLQLGEQLKVAKSRVTLIESAAATADLLSYERATYHVNLSNLWEDQGGLSVKLSHTGSLVDAVKMAETEFLRLNPGSTHIPARYQVQVQVGDMTVDVPRTYWKP